MPLTLTPATTTYVNKESTSMFSNAMDGMMAPFGDGSSAYTVKEVRFTAIGYGLLGLFFGARAGAKAHADGKSKLYGVIPLPA